MLAAASCLVENLQQKQQQQTERPPADAAVQKLLLLLRVKCNRQAKHVPSSLLTHSCSLVDNTAVL
jgi:hypothetical protein